MKAVDPSLQSLRIARQIGLVPLQRQAKQRYPRWTIVALWTDGTTLSDPSGTHHRELDNSGIVAELHRLGKMNQKTRTKTGIERTLPPSAPAA